MAALRYVGGGWAGKNHDQKTKIWQMSIIKLKSTRTPLFLYAGQNQILKPERTAMRG
jgi:hypothetical protein